MRQALVQALHHARHREAFGKRLIDQPLMRNVLADLALESEAATALTLRVARAVDAAPRDAERSRVRAADHGARQVLGVQARHRLRQRGAGMPGRHRLRRGHAAAAPVAPGAAQLDLGRQRQHPVPGCFARLQREPACRDAFFAELGLASGGHRLLDGEIGALHALLESDPSSLEGQSRWLVERMALALQASLLVRAGDAALADAFCDSRLGTRHGLAFGTLAADAPTAHLLARAWPD